MEEGAQWNLPVASEGVNRTLYFYKGEKIWVNDNEINADYAIELAAQEVVSIENGTTNASMILLQGKPIQEAVVQYGPFVMNTEAEIQQTFDDYRKTEFGGWPWPDKSQVFPRNKGRFALYSNGVEEKR